MTDCVVCGVLFRVNHMHPGITNEQWCPDCLPAVKLRVIELELNVTGRVDAQRSETV